MLKQSVPFTGEVGPGVCHIRLSVLGNERCWDRVIQRGVISVSYCKPLQEVRCLMYLPIAVSAIEDKFQ